MVSLVRRYYLTKEDSKFDTTHLYLPKSLLNKNKLIKMMKIGFDAKRIFNNSTGLGNYSRTLIQNLYSFYPENEYLLFTPQINNDIDTGFFKDNFEIVQPHSFAKPLWRNQFISNDISKKACDIYHGLSNEIPRGLKNIKSVVTIHDLIFRKLPHTYPKVDRLIYHEKTKYACKNADLILAISEHTKKDIIEYYSVDESKIKVVYQTVNPIYYQENKLDVNTLKEKFDLPQEFIFSVSSLEERKNVLGILKALNLMKPSDRIPLVILGEGKSYKEKLQQYIKDNHLGKWIIFIEKKVSLSELKCLYEAADVLVYPSFYEGFGLPVVEALLSKTPVITSNISSLPEAGGEHTLLINPNNPMEIKDAILKVLGDSELQEKMKIEGFEFAYKRFNQSKLTTELMDLYKKL